MKIGIDLDEVLAELLSAVIEYHNFAYKTAFTKNQFRSHLYWKTLDGTKDEVIRKVRDFYKTDYFKNVKPVAGAIKALPILKQDNDLFIITARPNEILEDTKEWVDRYFPNLFSGIYLANHFPQSGASIAKSQICDELEIEVMIEDSIESALDCAGLKRRVLLFDCPWNQQAELPSGISRVLSWKEILKTI